MYSGMTINVHAVVVGQRNGTVPGIVRASFNDSYHIYNKRVTREPVSGIDKNMYKS